MTKHNEWGKRRIEQVLEKAPKGVKYKIKVHERWCEALDGLELNEGGEAGEG